MVTRALASGAAVVLLAASASAANLPDWNIADVCRADSAPGQCSLFERRARNAVTGSWDVLPSDVRDACTSATNDPADHSWRTLAGCIEIEVLKAKEKRAVATRDTPAGPEPLSPAASEPASAESQANEAQPTESISGSSESAAAPSAPVEPANTTQQ